MKAITLFYDAHCGLSQRVREWMTREKKFVALHFVPYDSALAAEQFWGQSFFLVIFSSEAGKEGVINTFRQGWETEDFVSSTDRGVVA